MSTLVFCFTSCFEAQKELNVVEDSANAHTSSHKATVLNDAPIENPFETHHLKAMITNNVNTFFLYKGESMGLEYELLKLFFADKKMDIEVALIEDAEHIRDSMYAEGAHLAAATFIIPEVSLKGVLYSDPIYTTDLVLVKHKDHSAPVTNMTVIKDATYLRYLMSKNGRMPEGIHYSYSEGAASREWLLKKVHTKEIEATIADANETELVRALFPDIVVEKVLVKDAPVGIMFHAKMDTLRNAFNAWLRKNKNTSDYQWILKKYKTMPEQIETVMAVTPVENYITSISVYDELMKEYAKKIDWDWRLVASLIHQESKFNPRTRSWVGACGLMQVMPHTASVYGHIRHDQIFNPRSNIHAGTSYIHWLQTNFFLEPDLPLIERRKFILASYNAGAGHVEDARALCKKYQLKPNVWTANVETMILAKSNPEYYKDPVCKHGYCRGAETSAYVRNIMYYYSCYSNYF